MSFTFDNFEETATIQFVIAINSKTTSKLNKSKALDKTDMFNKKSNKKKKKKEKKKKKPPPPPIKKPKEKPIENWTQNKTKQKRKKNKREKKKLPPQWFFSLVVDVIC